MASTPGPDFSLVVPVYRNEESLDGLIRRCEELSRALAGRLEVVFVVDGSPDQSFERLRAALAAGTFPAQLLLLSRNFGSFPAIRAGLSKARGRFVAVMAADLQEPPELVLQILAILEEGSADVVVGTRTERADPVLSRLGSGLFWSLYRRFVQREMPPGGVDIFGCNASFKESLLSLRESHSSLVGLIFWMGFRRRTVEYARLPRMHGRSAWTLRRKLRYLSDSVFAFTDFPIQVLTVAGMIGLATSILFSLVILFAKLSGMIRVPGYSATVVVIAFFAAVNTFGLGVIGSYIWRILENTRNRPDTFVQHHLEFGGNRQ